MPCRVCTANDREALVEDLAREFWGKESGGTSDDRPWPNAGAYWQTIYRDFAERALSVIERSHQLT
jgi:hypothetical protein